MKFDRIRYINWFKENMYSAKYDLATSAVYSPSKEELGLTPEQFEYTGDVRYGYPELLEVIAARYRVPMKNIFITHGATMGIFLVYAALLEEGDEILLEAPNYEPMYRTALVFKARCKILERNIENKFQIQLESLERRISKNTKCIVISNLHNPSGVATNPEKLITIGQIARNYGSYVVSNEVYLDSINPLAPPGFTLSENIISIMSLSKVYGFEGLRVGWIFADEKLIERFKIIYTHIAGSANMPSQKLAAFILKKAPQLLQRADKIVSENMFTLEKWLVENQNIELVFPDRAPFCFPKLPAGFNDIEFVAFLKENFGTLVVPGEFFWASGFIRVGLGVKKEVLEKGLQHISQALNTFKKRKI